MSLDMSGTLSFRSLSESLFLISAIDPVTRPTVHSRSNSSDLSLIPHHLAFDRVALSNYIQPPMASVGFQKNRRHT